MSMELGSLLSLTSRPSSAILTYEKRKKHWISSAKAYNFWENMLIIATNQKARNKTMTDALMHTAHVSARLKDNGAYTQLIIARHPFTPQKEDEVITLDKTLLGYQ